METGEVEAAIKRLILRDNGIVPALQLLEQMLGTAAISEKEAEKLRRLIERRRIRLLAEAAVDGAEVDTAGINLVDVIASMHEMVGKTDNPDLMRMVDGVAATFGDDDAVGRMKPGGARARRSGNVVVVPSEGEDLGFAAAADEKKSKAVWLDDGEYFFSNKAIEGLGLRAGAPRGQARDVGLAELEKLHNEVKALAASEPTPAPPKEIIAGAGPITVLRKSAPMDEQPIRQEKNTAPEISPADLIAEAQVIDERRERAAVTDGTGWWRASDELIVAVIRAGSSGNPKAISPTGAVGLMQLLPSKAAAPGFGVRALTGSKEEIVRQLLNPITNKRIGTDYLNAMINRFGGDVELALAAYNQGVGKVEAIGGEDRSLENFALLYEEEAEEALPYVAKVLAGV